MPAPNPWIRLPLTDLSQIEATVESIQAVLNGVSQLLLLVAKVLDIISALLFSLSKTTGHSPS